MIIHSTFISASDFDGIEPFFGSIEINKYGDRVWRMNIHHFGKKFEWDIVGQKTYGVKGIQSDISVKSISWIGKRPSLYPKCGYEGCKGLSATARKYIYVVGIIFASILLVMLVAAVAYRMYKKDQDLKDLSWRVDVKDLMDLVNDLVPGDSETSVTGKMKIILVMISKICQIWSLMCLNEILYRTFVTDDNNYGN